MDYKLRPYIFKFTFEKKAHTESASLADLSLPLYVQCLMVLLQVHLLIAQIKYQWRSQNVEKVTHIKGRLMDQAVVLFNCALF